LNALWQYPGATAQSWPVIDEDAREGCDLGGNIAPGIHRLTEAGVHYHHRVANPLILVMKPVVAHWDNEFDDCRFAGIYSPFVGLTPRAWRNQNYQDQRRHNHLQCFQISSCRSGGITIVDCVRMGISKNARLQAEQFQPNRFGDTPSLSYARLAPVSS